jgi:hypothetical protein
MANTLARWQESRPGPIGSLTKPSVIDCNHAELIRRADLTKRVDHDYDFKIEVRDTEIPEKLKTQVSAAIKNSPLISNYIKKLI